MTRPPQYGDFNDDIYTEGQGTPISWKLAHGQASVNFVCSSLFSSSCKSLLIICNSVSWNFSYTSNNVGRTFTYFCGAVAQLRSVRQCSLSHLQRVGHRSRQPRWERLCQPYLQVIALRIPNISPLQPFSNCRNYLGGVLYVGDQRAAKDSTLLTRCPRSVIQWALLFAKPCRLGVRAVVNCAPNLLNVHEEKFSYLRFPIGRWRQHCGEDEHLLQAFLTTFLQVNWSTTKNCVWKNLSQFVAGHLSAGESILIHCMAGAHRFSIIICFFFPQMRPLGVSLKKDTADYS